MARHEKGVVLDAGAGCNIWDTARDAVIEKKHTRSALWIRFNDLFVPVYDGDSVNNVCDRYQEMHVERRGILWRGRR